ncbi:hypothetical protein QWZ06_12110 [Chryseobacterium tructae]|uniref:Bacteriocin n=1 Tax=Chryseobacterium tructae TaxID=1037380 RepID=A0ABV7XWQ7_9FLAO|nr:hypothetical protein [Chryseobacterium tructae]MDN3692972.1 hypothetical protein [Chryseobacterium tructae]
MKTKKVLKFSKETVVILNNKSKQALMGGQQQNALFTKIHPISGCVQCVIDIQ